MCFVFISTSPERLSVSAFSCPPTCCLYPCYPLWIYYLNLPLAPVASCLLVMCSCNMFSLFICRFGFPSLLTHVIFYIVSVKQNSLLVYPSCFSAGHTASPDIIRYVSSLIALCIFIYFIRWFCCEQLE